jgi:hypothetical protein
MSDSRNEWQGHAPATPHAWDYPARQERVLRRSRRPGAWSSYAWLILLVFFIHPAWALLPFPLTANQRGTVFCLENFAYSYDVYLPPAYSVNGPALPILYTMSPGGGGMVSAFQSTCSSLNIICIGIIGPKNGVPWDKVLREIHAVTRDVRLRILYDPTAEFAGGLSGGGECSYMFSRFRSQHVAGLLEMAGWLGRSNMGTTVAYYSTDRVLTNLLIARTSGDTDTGAIFYNPFDSNYLATCGVVIKDWIFSGGHTTPPDSVKSACLSWLLSQRIPAAPRDMTNSFALGTNWQTRITAGDQESVLRECVSNLVNFPRGWYAYQAQLTLDQLLTNYTAVRSLSVSNLACGNFASGLFYYYARATATNADWPRYKSCLKALTGITSTNDLDGTIYITDIPITVVYPGQSGTVSITSSINDRAGDIYALLTNYNHFPNPLLQGSPNGPGRMNLWVSKDTPGLAYSLQSRTNLINDIWQDVPVPAFDLNTVWSAGLDIPVESASGYYRMRATPLPAISAPWPPQ